MNLLHISDWHTTPKRFEQTLTKVLVGKATPDMLIVTGDMIQHTTWSPWSDPNEAMNQATAWVEMVSIIKQLCPGTEIVATPGNHDFCGYDVLHEVTAFDSSTPEVQIIAGIKIAGFTGITAMSGYWTNELDAKSIKLVLKVLEDVAQEADILVTHSPPLNILDGVPRHVGPDENVGFRGMLQVLKRLPKLKLHCFGHIHEQGGKVVKRGKIQFSNASCSANWLTL